MASSVPAKDDCSKMSGQENARRTVIGLIFLVTILVSIFAVVTIKQITWTQQLNTKLELSRQELLGLKTRCETKRNIRDLSINKLKAAVQTLRMSYGGSERSKRQTGTLEQMLSEMMVAQEKILLSHCLNTTKLCVTGGKGLTGLKGDMGPAGPLGAPGQIGPQGVKGDTGPIGLTGAKGNRGPQGDTGVKGARGPKGMQGRKGDPGVLGQRGPAGKDGIAGAKGEKGDKGATGPVGLSGIQGTNGIKGTKGDPGLMGVKGDQGLRGIIGPSGVDLQKDCLCVKQPKIDVFQPNQIAITKTLGSRVTLTCDSNSIPKPTITWTKPASGCLSQTVTNTTLEISSLQPSELGTYKCTATNEYGSTTRVIQINSNVTGALNCNFENGNTCLWKNSKQDLGTWQLHSGATPTLNTGPDKDHTLGNSNGHFLYSEGAGGRSGNEVDIFSPELAATGVACLSFWYHMYGSSEGSLRVETHVCDSVAAQTVHLDISGNQGNTWHHAFIALPTVQQNHKLVIKSVRGNDVYSDVAIDDIVYTDGKCKISLSRTGAQYNNITVNEGSRLELNCGITSNSPTTYTWSKVGGCGNYTNATGESFAVTDYAAAGHEGTYICTASNGPGSSPISTTFDVLVNSNNVDTCTFESGMCGWTQDKTDVFDWTIISGHSDSLETGPMNDHTRNNSKGKYMYIESSSPRVYGDEAVMRSHLMKGNQSACFSFYYYMYGAEINSLKVTVEDACTHAKRTLFTASGEKGQAWLHQSVDIAASTVPNDYNILISANVGHSYHGDVSIDDLEIKQSHCAGGRKFECDFETDSCTWNQSKTDDFDWSRQAGATASSGTGPTGDHTDPRGKGHYLYTEASNRNQGEKADLVSPVFPAGQDSCLHLATNMYGDTMGAIRVILKANGQETILATFDQHDNVPVWRPRNINVPAQMKEFRIVIEGIIGSSYTSDAAIDDISVETGQC